MSKKNNQTKSNNVGNLKKNYLFELNNQTISNELEKDKSKNSNENFYEEFCNRYLCTNLKEYGIEELEKIYNDGNMLLDLIYDSSKNSTPKEISTTTMRIQYILTNVIYEIENKKYEKNNKSGVELQNRINSTISQNNAQRKELSQTKREIKRIKNDVNSIMATIISIVLTISIISSAVIGIEKIDPNYIIPFVSSLIFFGMIMILFIYSIYKNKIGVSSWIILTIIFLLCILLWTAGLNKWYDISKDPVTENVENVIKKDKTGN